MGRVLTYLNPQEDIGVPCQQEPFDLELLTVLLQKDMDTSTTQEEKLERIPLVKKVAAPADIMDLEEVEHKICQYCQLWKLYTETSVKLKRKSTLSQESALTACKLYGPYITDILRQVDEVMKLFAMEKELRLVKNRGHFPIPKITPQSTKVETTHDLDKALEAVDEEVTEMIQAVRQSEENHERKQEQAKNRDEQLRLTRQTSRQDFNLVTRINSTPIRNNNARTDQPAVHFDMNTIHHIYPPTNMNTNGDRYEPPANDSILNGAGLAPGGQFASNTTGITGRNDPWRYNNGTNSATNTNPQGCTTRPTGRKSPHNSSPNSSDNRNGPTCFKCGEQGHMRMNCRERVFCTHCRTTNHDTKACRKYQNSAPSPTNSHVTTGYHPTAMPPPLLGIAANIQQPHQTVASNNGPLFQNLFDNNQP